MIIVYIEASPEMIRARIDKVLGSLVTDDLIWKKRPRTIELKTGIKFMFFTAKEIENDSIRGLNIAAAFVNCYLDSYTRAKVAYQVRII